VESYAKNPQNGRKFVTKATFCSVFKKTWTLTTKRRETVVNGFAKCGLFPSRKLTAKEFCGGKELIPSSAQFRVIVIIL
jgi:hypothetical protein